MASGQSLNYVAGGDPGMPPLHVPYSEPKPKSTGLDWSALRGEEPAAEPRPPRSRRCKSCGVDIDPRARHRLCDDCRDAALAVDPHRQAEPALAATTQEEPMPEITTVDEADPPLVVTEYVRDAAAVLSRTEGHPDKLVRDLRKLAAQALQALQVYEIEKADAWHPGADDGNWGSAPVLIQTSIKQRKKSKEELEREAQWAEEAAQRKEAQRIADLARHARAEHVVELTAALKIPKPLEAHIRLAAARLVADLTAGDIEDVIATSGVPLTRVKNDYHNDAIASEICALPLPKVLAVFGAAIASKNTSHLYVGYGKQSDVARGNAQAYWSAFRDSGYELPEVDLEREAELVQTTTDDGAGEE